jgi:UDP-GlcNAc:undecaprenyl-phosphate GlcNAc-1-phosphate transferase
MDGLNGLASGSAAIACAGIVAASGLPRAWPEAVLLAGILGFLPFNFPVARLFMGDVGSQFLGFMVAGFALRHAADPGLAMILPFAVLPLLADVGVTLIRRWRRGERLTQPHRSHVYQGAHAGGMNASRVTLIYWGLAGWGATLGAVSPWVGGKLAVPITLALVIVPILAWMAMVRYRITPR